eukprot:711024_1
MAYLNEMTTKFTDMNGEEFIFLGTSISYSEKKLINLEKEHDKECELVIDQLLSDGYFEEEWTDYYAETDDDENEYEFEDQNNEFENINNHREIDECNKLNNNNKNKYILSQLNVPLFSHRKISNVNTFQNQLALRQNQFLVNINVKINGKYYMQMIKVVN